MTAGPPAFLSIAPVVEPFPLIVSGAEGAIDQQMVQLSALGYIIVGSSHITHARHHSKVSAPMPLYQVFRGFDLCIKDRFDLPEIMVGPVREFAVERELFLPTMSELLQFALFLEALRTPGTGHNARIIGFLYGDDRYTANIVIDIGTKYISLHDRKLQFRAESSYVVLVKR